MSDSGMRFEWRRILLIALVLLLAALLVGCSDGGGGEAPPPNSPPVRLAVTSADPGQFVALSHDSLAPGATVDVWFEWGGYRLSQQARVDADGRLWVQVPPYLDPLGEPTGGRMAVGIAGASAAGLDVNPAPLFGADVQPGDVLRWLFLYARGRFAAALLSLAEDELNTGVDTGDLRDSISRTIDSLDIWIAELAGQGQLSLPGADAQPLVLDAEALRRIDRMLFALIYGASDFAGATTAVAAARYQAAELPHLPQQQAVFDCLQGWADQLQGSFERVSSSSGALTAGVGLLAGLGAAAAGATAAPAILIGGLAAGATALVLGPLAESVEGLGHRIEVLIDSDDADTYQFGERFLQTAGNAAESLYFTLLGGADKIGDMLSNIYNAYGVYRNSRDLACQQPVQSNLKVLATRVDGFCADTAVPPPFTVLLTPPQAELQAGASGQWILAALGGSQPYSFVCDWGDGYSQLLADPRAVNALSYSYAAAGSYRLQVSAADAYGQAVNLSVGVQVEAPPPACQVYAPSDRWLMEYDQDCNGTIDGDSLWHLLEDGRISDHWLGVIPDYYWHRDGQLITMEFGYDDFWYEGILATDCRSISDGQMVFVPARPDAGCWQARKY